MVRSRYRPHHPGPDGAVLIALRLVGECATPVRQAAWYKKNEATFSDVLAFVRRAIWAGKYFVNSKTSADRLELCWRALNSDHPFALNFDQGWEAGWKASGCG